MRQTLRGNYQLTNDLNLGAFFSRYVILKSYNMYRLCPELKSCARRFFRIARFFLSLNNFFFFFEAEGIRIRAMHSAKRCAFLLLFSFGG